MNHDRNRSRSPDDYSKRSLLSKIDKRELQKVRVAVKRSGLQSDGQPTLPLERDIRDPKQISSLVHIRKSTPPCAPPRVPIFSGDIKVNQDCCEDRTVFTHDRGRRRSRSSSYCRSRSRSKSYKGRRSQSTDRYKRRSERRDRSRSRSRRRSRSRHRSKSRDRRYRDESRDKSRYRSRSRSSRRSTQKPYESHERKKRSVTPLRPGEYRPGHPDLALRKRRELSRSRTRSRSRSPKYSTSRERSIKYRSPTKTGPGPVPMMGLRYDFAESYGHFGPMNPMPPYRPMPPDFYPQMYPHPSMMMPRMRMPYHRMPMLRPRFPVYNSTRKTATATAPMPPIDGGEEETGSVRIVEQPSDDPEPANSMEISSSNQKCESETGASEAVAE